LKTEFRASFRRDLKRIRDARILVSVRQAILDAESAAERKEIPNIKKIKGANNAFRIRVDDYRIGLFIESGVAEFVRVLPRRDIYRKFPGK
jgi:mRNA interferase RelE/StbE